MAGVDDVETQTQEMEIPEEDNLVNFPRPRGWGRICPCKAGLEELEMFKDCYGFGRSKLADYHLNLTDEGFFLSISQRHFLLQKENKFGVVVLTDLSKCGTFVNGECIGTNKKRVISDGDEIGICAKNNTIFIIKLPFHSNEEEPVTNCYVFSKEIGSGSFGKVLLAFRKSDNKSLAAKILNTKKLTFHQEHIMDTSEYSRKEAIFLLHLNHPCIVQCFDVAETATKLYIFLAYMEGGDLFSFLNQHFADLTETLIKRWFYFIASAIYYLHERNITHRDLKPENILLTSKDPENTLLQLTDFGVSKLAHNATAMKTCVGTRSYLAPEVWISQGFHQYTKKIDNWSAGAVLYVMLSGRLPINNSDPIEFERNLFSGNISFSGGKLDTVSRQAIDITRKLLTVDANLRMTIASVLRHPWLNDQDMVIKAISLMNREKLERSRENSTANSTDSEKELRTKLVRNKPFDADHESPSPAFKKPHLH